MKIKKAAIFAVAMFLGAVIFQSQAFAAKKLVDVASTAEVQINDDANSTLIKSVDPIVNKLNLNFDINESVADGDYFEFETHALPQFPNQDIYSGADKKTVIGKLSLVKFIYGSREYQAGDNIPSEFYDMQPSQNRRYLYRITFNKEAEKVEDIKFLIGLSKRGTGVGISSVNYNTEVYVKVNDSKIFSKEYTVQAYSKAVRKTELWHHQTTLNSDTGNISMTYGYKSKENLTGGKIEISFDDGSMYKFKTPQPITIRKQMASNFIYSDNSIVNKYGLIFKDQIGTWDSTVISATDKVLTFNIDRQDTDYMASGIGNNILELTESGKRYLKENGKMPSATYRMRLFRADGSEAFSKSYTINVIVSGSVSSFISNLKIEEPKEDPKKDEDAEEVAAKDETLANKEIEAPNTGFESNILPIFIAGISIFSLATFMIRKKI